MAYGKSSKPSRGNSRAPSQTTKPLSPQSSNDMVVTGLTPSPLNLNPITGNSVKTTLNKDVFNKTAFDNTVNTNFTQLDQEAPDLSFFDPNLATVEDLFNIYQNLFFTIPKFGQINSHQYLVVESTEYTGFIENQVQIDALLEEITDLREQNLQLQLDIAELLGAKVTIDQAIRQTGEAASLEDLLQQEANLGAEQSNSSSDNPPPPPPANTGTGGIGSGGGGGNSGGNNELIDASSQNGNPGGPPVPGRPGSNINPGNLVY